MLFSYNSGNADATGNSKSISDSSSWFSGAPVVSRNGGMDHQLFLA